MILLKLISRNFTRMGPKKVIVNLNSNVSTIVGPCGSGKTSLFVALQACFMLIQRFLDADSPGDISCADFIKGNILSRAAAYIFIIFQMDQSSWDFHLAGFNKSQNADKTQFFYGGFTDPDNKLDEFLNSNMPKLLQSDADMSSEIVKSMEQSNLVFQYPSKKLPQVTSNLLREFLSSITVVTQDHGLKQSMFSSCAWNLTSDKIKTLKLNAQAAQLLEILTSLKYHPNEIMGSSKAFSKQIDNAEVEIGSIDMLSAGEADAVFCVAAVFGTTDLQESKQARMVFLDEPGQNLGAHQRSLFRSRIEAFANNSNVPTPHIILITHHVEMLNAATLPAGVLRFSCDYGSLYRKNRQTVTVTEFKPSSPQMKLYYQRLDHMELYFAKGVLIVEGRRDVEMLYLIDQYFQHLNNLLSNGENMSNERKELLRTNLQSLNCENFHGIVWKIIAADSCWEVRKKAKLCSEMNINFFCIYDFDYVCFGAAERNIPDDINLVSASAVEKLSHLGGHIFNSFDKSRWKRPLDFGTSIQGRAADLEADTPPNPPVINLNTVILFLVKRYWEMDTTGDVSLYGLLFAADANLNLEELKLSESITFDSSISVTRVISLMKKYFFNNHYTSPTDTSVEKVCNFEDETKLKLFLSNLSENLDEKKCLHYASQFTISTNCIPACQFPEHGTKKTSNKNCNSATHKSNLVAKFLYHALHKAIQRVDKLSSDDATRLLRIYWCLVRFIFKTTKSTDLLAALRDDIEVESTIAGLTYYAAYGCGNDDYFIWSPAVADIEGILLNKNYVAIDKYTDPTVEEKKNPTYDRLMQTASYLCWKFGERNNLANLISKKKKQLETVSIEDKRKMLKEVFPLDRRWDPKKSPAIGLSALFKRLRERCVAA